MKIEGTVYDLGYAPHEGPRLGRSGAMRAILRDGMRRALGLRRKARSKILPWAMIAAAVVPATIIVTLTFFLQGFGLQGSPFGSHAEYFNLIGTLSLLFVALVTPTLLVPDRKHGVLSIYASRPVRAGDYLMARAGALLLLGSLFILIPQATLYIGIAALHADGLGTGLAESLSEVPAILGSTLAFVVGYGAPAFLVSIYIKRTSVASGVFVVGMFLSAAVTEVIPRSGATMLHKVLALTALPGNPLSVRDWFFGQSERTPIERAGLPLWAGAAAILAVAALTAFLAHRRYRRDL